jgi:hypothetical protein
MQKQQQKSSEVLKLREKNDGNLFQEDSSVLQRTIIYFFCSTMMQAFLGRA